MSHPTLVQPGQPVELAAGVHWIGALDPDMRRFDIILNTANGTSYNAYCVRGAKGVAVIDTVKIEFSDEFFARLESVARYDEIRAIVLNHLEPDHSGALPELMRRAPQAERRLKVLQSLDSLGAGFELASHDLDIRGAGNLLGDDQSGHIREVGYELYQEMLAEAVAHLQAGITDLAPDKWSPQIAVGTPVMIPEEYVPDLSVRLGLYRRLADLEDPSAVDAAAAELVDRFGPLPDEVKTLLEVVAIKALCRRANVERIEAGPKGAVVTFRDGIFPNPEGLVAWIYEGSSVARVRPDQKLVIFRDWQKIGDRLRGTKSVMETLVGIAERAKAA
jgi:transcription-repair coupling factor (superfamily II helicase)